MPDIRSARTTAPSGFTIIEVVIAAMIFTIAVAGVFATTASLSRPAAETTDEVTAAFVGKRILEQLRRDVDASAWDSVGTSPLHPSGGDGSGVYDATATETATLLAPVIIDGVTYTPTYTVVADPDGTNGRKVTLTVTW